MKKRIAVLLCALSLLVSCTPVPALAAEQTDQHYPVKVEEYTYGPLDELRVNKIYQLSLSDDPRGIPTEDFERNGRRYYLLDLTRQDDVGVDTQPYTETVTMDSKTGELSAVMKLLEGEKDVTTEDGYSGTLVLDHTSVKVEVKGYQTSTRNLSATRTYPSLSDADLSLVPKTVSDSGSTLTLADVQWANDGTYYTATAKYTGTATSRYATGYTVTANYTGTVAKTDCKVVTYTAVFGSEEIPSTEPPIESPAETAPPLTDDTGHPSKEVIAMISVFGCIGGVMAIVAVGLWITGKIKERRQKH